MNLHKIESLAHLHHAKLIRNASLLTVGMSALLLGGCMRTSSNLSPTPKPSAVSFQPLSQIRAEHTDLRTALGHKGFTAPKLTELFDIRDNIFDSDINTFAWKPYANHNTEFRLGRYYILARPSVKSTNNFSDISDRAPSDFDAMTYHLSRHGLSIKVRHPEEDSVMPRNFVRYVSYHLHSVAKAKHSKELKLVLRPTKLEMRDRVMHHLNHSEQKDYPLTIITRSGNHAYHDGLKPDGVLPKE